MIRNKDFAILHGGMKLVSMGDGLENVSSKIWEEKVWKH